MTSHLPRRPLRSVMLCNPAYLSSYVVGVGQAMGQLGHWHRSISVLDETARVVRQLDEMRPDVVWTHMVPWPPPGAPTPAWMLVEILAGLRRGGARVALHDGDPRPATRYEHDLSAAFDVALCNHSLPREPWRIPTVRWPYGAMSQAAIGDPVAEWSTELLFAGIVREGEIYGGRSALVGALKRALGDRMAIVTAGLNNRMLAADVAPSAGAVLGFGRPEVPGWADTRIFQYPGAGGILIHDHADEFLEAGVHYVRFRRAATPEETVHEVLVAMDKAKAGGQAMREAAFRHVQGRHTWRHRVETALSVLLGGGDG